MIWKNSFPKRFSHKRPIGKHWYSIKKLSFLTQSLQLKLSKFSYVQGSSARTKDFKKKNFLATPKWAEFLSCFCKKTLRKYFCFQWKRSAVPFCFLFCLSTNWGFLWTCIPYDGLKKVINFSGSAIFKIYWQ